MAEHNQSGIREIETLDWQVFRHHTGLYPQGVFYVLTSRDWILTANLVEKLIELDYHGRKAGARFKKVVANKVGTKTTIGPGYGYAFLILFSEQAVADHDRLKEEARRLRPSLAKLETARLEAVTSANPSATSIFHFLVKKPSAIYPSVFRGKFSDGRLRIVLMRFDANHQIGQLMIAPADFAYRVGGDFIAALDTPAGGANPRTIGTVLAIVESGEYLSLGNAHKALVDAKNKSH